MINNQLYILFIGNFLSKHKGTIGPIEGVMKHLDKMYNISAASYFSNKTIRLLDMMWKSSFLPYNIIHIDVYSSSALLFAAVTSTIARIRRKYIILNLHGGGLLEAYSSKKRMLSFIFNKSNRIVTPSKYLMSFFTDKGYNLTYLPNSVNVENFPYKVHNSCNHKLLWVRAFTPSYNPDLAIRTLFEIRKEFPDATLTMVGPDKGQLEEMKNLITSLALNDYITITGPIPNNELSTYYLNHDVYLNTTSYESFGVAVLEAAACGIPIVSTSVGEIPYMWKDGENILLVNSFDEKDMAGKVSFLFKNNSFANELAEHAYKKSKEFEWKNIELLWLNLFK